MACDSGINVPPARAASFSELGHTFIVQRFDRQNGSRRMYASAHALLDARSDSNYSYLDPVELIEHVGTSATIGHELEQLFRRATQLADQIRAAIRGWEARATRMGIKGSEIALMGSVIDPDR